MLADAALKGRLYKENVNDLIRSYAAHSLGKIGTRKDIATLEAVLTTRRGMSKNVQRSAAIGLGLLGRQVAGEARVDVAKALLKSYDKVKDKVLKDWQYQQSKKFRQSFEKQLLDKYQANIESPVRKASSP